MPSSATNTFTQLGRKDQNNIKSAEAIGQNLKALRQSRKLTIDTVAKASGVSGATISRIENGRLSPTYEVIVNLAQALDVDIRDLFYLTQRSALSGWRTLTKSGRGQFVETPNYKFELLCNDVVSKDFLVFSAEILNFNFEAFGELQRHAGQEQIIVTDGEVEVLTEHYEPTVLQIGDSISFDSTMGHAVISRGDKPAKVLWICSSLEMNV